MQSLPEILKEAHTIFENFSVKMREQQEKVDAALSYYGGLEEMFAWQKDIFLKKLNTDFEIILQTIERKKKELSAKICKAYDGHIAKAKNLQEGLTALKESLTAISTPVIASELDYISLSSLLPERVSQISNLMELDIKGNELDLLASCFVNDPYPKVERAISLMNFFPVS